MPRKVTDIKSGKAFGRWTVLKRDTQPDI